MLRVILARITPVLLIFGTALALASATSAHGSKELDLRVNLAEQALRKETKLADRVQEVRKLRDYVRTELTKLRALTRPDADDNRFALELVGYEDDLGSFLDKGAQDFSDERCLADRIALVHSYRGAGTEDQSEGSLPKHAKESLKILNLLCGEG